eukprot:gene16693-biopygen3803
MYAPQRSGGSARALYSELGGLIGNPTNLVAPPGRTEGRGRDSREGEQERRGRGSGPSGRGPRATHDFSRLECCAARKCVGRIPSRCAAISGAPTGARSARSARSAHHGKRTIRRRAHEIATLESRHARPEIRRPTGAGGGRGARRKQGGGAGANRARVG